jgi:Holliday junction resolvase-like predicted endonuclease
MAHQLPIDIHDFEKLRTKNYVYVDKTQLIHQMITKGEMYFLSRPRRFGKSLLISTLGAIFQGKRHLFKDLWIDQSDYTWEQHPVIWLDMSAVENKSAELFGQSLNEQLDKIAAQYGIELADSVSVAGRLDNLILQLAKNNRNVVVLIDEYDSPLINQIHHPETAIENREILKQFYTILKVQNANLRFVLLTGVSKFSKVSVFSGLNNLQDISLLPDYATLLGYTEQELTNYFTTEIYSLAQKEGLSQQEILDKIKHWYNGYRFSEEDVSVYNPFSTLLLFKQRRFSAFWFESATPTFLINLIQKRQFNITDVEDSLAKVADFSTYEIDQLKIIPLLYQTGYLTIQAYDPTMQFYTLSYPNLEVKAAFLDSLLKSFAPFEETIQNKLILSMITALKKPSIDDFVEQLKVFLASIPYEMKMKEEKYYQNIFYLLFKSVGLQVNVEVHTNLGRIDVVVENKESLLIFEIKVDKTAQEALEQIKAKGYADQYRHQQKAIYLIGLNISSEKRNVDGYVVEQLA